MPLKRKAIGGCSKGSAPAAKRQTGKTRSQAAPKKPSEAENSDKPTATLRYLQPLQENSDTFPYFSNGAVFIIIDRNDPKYQYRLHKSILSRYSAKLKKTFEEQADEYDEDMKNELVKGEFRLELMYSEPRKQWTLQKTSFTVPAIRTAIEKVNQKKSRFAVVVPGSKAKSISALSMSQNGELDIPNIHSALKANEPMAAVPEAELFVSIWPDINDREVIHSNSRTPNEQAAITARESAYDSIGLRDADTIQAQSVSLKPHNLDPTVQIEGPDSDVHIPKNFNESKSTELNRQLCSGTMIKKSHNQPELADHSESRNALATKDDLNPAINQDFTESSRIVSPTISKQGHICSLTDSTIMSPQNGYEASHETSLNKHKDAKDSQSTKASARSMNFDGCADGDEEEVIFMGEQMSSGSIFKPSPGPPHLLCEAFDSILGIPYGRMPRFSTSNINTTIEQCDFLSDHARRFEVLEWVHPFICNALYQFGQDFYRVIRSQPCRFLKRGLDLHSSLIFKEAVIHVVAKYANDTLTEEDFRLLHSLPNTTQHIIQAKYLQLTQDLLRLENELFKCNILFKDIPNRLKQGEMDTFHTWIVVQLWRDYLCENLSKLGDPSKSALLYRKLARGGDAYLDVLSVRGLLTSFNLGPVNLSTPSDPRVAHRLGAHGFSALVDFPLPQKNTPSNEAGISYFPADQGKFSDLVADLKLLKDYAKALVADICVNNSMLDVEAEGINYFTCIKVEDSELPWHMDSNSVDELAR